MNFSQRTTVLALVSALYAGGAAAAEGGGLFIGAGLGSGSIDDSLLESGSFFDVDDDETFYRLFAGYQVSSWLTVDGGYVDFGDFDTNLSLPAGGNPPQRIGTTDVDGVYGGVTLHYFVPDTHWHVFGSVGILGWDAEFDDGSTLRANDDGAEPYYGIGAGYTFGNGLRLTGELMRYELDELELDTFGINLQWFPGFINRGY